MHQLESNDNILTVSSFIYVKSLRFFWKWKKIIPVFAHGLEIPMGVLEKHDSIKNLIIYIATETELLEQRCCHNEEHLTWWHQKNW